MMLPISPNNMPPKRVHKTAEKNEALKMGVYMKLLKKCFLVVVLVYILVNPSQIGGLVII
jgi:hypothetical protein